MATSLSSGLPADWTAADMQEHLGGVPLNRIRMVPPPGMATEEDVLEVRARTDQICELVDGVLVEKAMGSYESLLAGIIIHFLHRFLDTHNLGIVLGGDGPLKILPNQVRIPDVSFIRWQRLPGGKVSRDPILAVVPDLVVEVLSKSNTRREMERKVDDYSAAGVRLIWYIDPDTRTAQVYTSPGCRTPVGPDDSLSGGDVLPGFEIKLCDLFARADRSGP